MFRLQFAFSVPVAGYFRKPSDHLGGRHVVSSSRHAGLSAFPKQVQPTQISTPHQTYRSARPLDFRLRSPSVNPRLALSRNPTDSEALDVAEAFQARF